VGHFSNSQFGATLPTAVPSGQIFASKVQLTGTVVGLIERGGIVFCSVNVAWYLIPKRKAIMGRVINIIKATVLDSFVTVTISFGNCISDYD
jgi:hypothetical protein